MIKLQITPWPERRKAILQALVTTGQQTPMAIQETTARWEATNQITPAITAEESIAGTGTEVKKSKSLASYLD